MSVTRWEQGRADIDRLITQGRLERVTPNQQHAQVLLEQARKAAVRAFGWMRQIRNSSAYPEPDGATATGREVTDAIEAAHAIIQVAAKVIPVMPVYGR